MGLERKLSAYIVFFNFDFETRRVVCNLCYVTLDSIHHIKEKFSKLLSSSAYPDKAASKSSFHKFTDWFTILILL